MATRIEPVSPTEIAAANVAPRGPVWPSPASWQDQTLYLVLPDRFSDGQEEQRPLYNRSEPGCYKASDKRTWMDAGKAFQGGTIRGITSKLDYLQDLGITTLLICPVWRQRQDLATYHGYGVQDLLEVDERFGCRQDLRDLVDAAHSRGMYVVLDIVFNHVGNNWFYEDDGSAWESMPYRFCPPYPFHGWRTAKGKSVAHITNRDDGVWPLEFQNVDWYIRAGRIGRWEPRDWEEADHPNNEYQRGDFADLKALDLRRADVLAAVVRVFEYWIAISDCDGFRIDSANLVPREACRAFCAAIKEYAEAIGKTNFLLLGEVTSWWAMGQEDIENRNLDAILDIGDPATRLAGIVKGWKAPGDYFDQFPENGDPGVQVRAGSYHVSAFDDHDMVGRPKRRFIAQNEIPHRNEQAAHAVGLQLTTLGIPCIYYGTEQAFDGNEDRHDARVEPLAPDGDVPFADRYIREAMFGGSFGAYETCGCHFFDPSHPTYVRIAAIARLRNRKDDIGAALRCGRQYLRETSVDGGPFAIPERGQLIAWSRLYHRQEVLMALNSCGTARRCAFVEVDWWLHQDVSRLSVLYCSDWVDEKFAGSGFSQSATVQVREGRKVVQLDLPPAGMIILA